MSIVKKINIIDVWQLPSTKLCCSHDEDYAMDIIGELLALEYDYLPQLAAVSAEEILAAEQEENGKGNRRFAYLALDIRHALSDNNLSPSELFITLT